MPDDIPIIHGFSIGQLLDKTIVATNRVYVYRNAQAGAQPVGYVSPGQPIGVLYSWLSPDFSQNRDRYWLQFYPASGGGYYYVVPFSDGDFDWSSIQQQGAITVIQEQQQQEQEKQDSETPWYEKLFNWGSSGVIRPIVNGALILGGVYVGVKYILPEILKHTKKKG